MKKLSLVLAIFLAACKSTAPPAAKTEKATARPIPRIAVGDTRPLYYDREINPEEDLEGRSLRALALMRNTIYARAGKKFRKKWLNDYFTTQPWYHPFDQMDETRISDLDRKNAELVAKDDARLTGAEASSIIRNADPATPEGKIEIRLASMRLGKWAGGVDDERTPLEDPTMLDTQLSLEQLSDFSLRDLRLLRNLVYARRGRPFHSELIKAYFIAVDWYKPDASYTDARLTVLDQRNIKIIRSLEDQLGGPLTDWQHKKDDGWFAES